MVMDDEVCVVGRDVGNLLTNRDLRASDKS